jgi:hypothetical protein
LHPAPFAQEASSSHKKMPSCDSGVNHLLKWVFSRLPEKQHLSTLAQVFHRILDFKQGLNFYSGPFILNNVGQCVKRPLLNDPSCVTCTAVVRLN